MSDASAPRIALVQTQAENAGAQEISRLLAADFTARGFDVRQLFFFHRTGSFDASAQVEFCADERPSGPLAFLRFLFQLYTRLRRMRPDVVVTFQHYGNVIAAPVARLAGARRVVANQVTAGALLAPWLVGADKWLGRLGAYDRIVVNSDVTADMFKDYPASYRQRIVHIDHGFEDKTQTIGKAEARAQLGLPLDVPLLGCAARLHPSKQLDVAIAILPAIDKAHLALAGQGADRPRLEAAAREAGVSARVHFLGELAPERIGLFLAALDCFVFPSAAESFGLAPVEAAQTGLPVVANELPVLKDVLSVEGEPCAIFADARDHAAFGNAVNLVLDDPALAAKLGAVGRRLKGRYPLSAMTGAYAELIGKLIGSGDASRP
ncbi:glycosyltransferase family 4 protein [Methylocapsa sp. S129]|uniref:glycosyltransferase family 4 protein n=1 Tax=Methylocapsa sp. S129 TaxID=1641869 RepID=UPI00131A754C|nr:glycosyltransferase family 4 protein [Methylocapsa sp. S129]